MRHRRRCANARSAVLTARSLNGSAGESIDPFALPYCSSLAVKRSMLAAIDPSSRGTAIKPIRVRPQHLAEPGRSRRDEVSETPPLVKRRETARFVSRNTATASASLKFDLPILDRRTHPVAEKRRFQCRKFGFQRRLSVRSRTNFILMSNATKAFSKFEAETEVVDLFLSLGEVEALTGRRRPTRQVEALCGMGIENIRNPAGQVIVLRRHVEERLGGHSSTRTTVKSTEPNWSALSHAKASAK
jgi:hypothetical protein